ncbi:OmpH family outer membrane protein [Jannaschia pohangensis]|uniref:Periplasmic chaperone for outer membrane proteins Skp n=1 Tax=Jannaschia pohangensis TaxID=390807 RepID=A0A1I3GW28_9RHOB|nr:OmpH family outer membrane protein [Jannaschia pohangensis]SFI27559.1 periplasmic chaperone for outer membrane proteins Skp [Jannaschia pohangensis]
MRRLAGLLLAGCVLALPVSAQQAGMPPVGVPQSAVVVLDRDQLFSTSLFGRRVARDVEAASTELATENRQIEADLEAEEARLTELRATMDPAEFRQLAIDFDARVTDIRRAQDAKGRAITGQIERAQQIFFERINPILVDLAREAGALVILDRRFVVASADQVNITAVAQARVDSILGEGPLTDAPAPPPQSPAETPPAAD